MQILIFVILLLVSCGRHEPVAASGVSFDELRSVYDQNCSEATALADSSGWIFRGDGDGWLWEGLLASTECGSSLRLTDLAEAPDEPGRFDRSPPYGTLTSDNASWSSWSRDMGLGLFWYSWRRGDRALLERHADRGKTRFWQLGEPFGDGRSVYPPAFIGLLYSAIYRLGGGDNPLRHVPDLYPPGLEDYRSHLQVLSIALRAELSDVGNRSFLSMDTTDGELSRLKEHAGREPGNPLFASALAIYDGSYDQAIAACLNPTMSSYVRCSEPRKCYLSEWLFACDLILRRSPVLQ